MEDLKQQVELQRRTSSEQIENMKIDEASNLERMESVVLELENSLNTMQKDYDKLSIDHEQLMAARDQSGFLFTS